MRTTSRTSGSARPPCGQPPVGGLWRMPTATTAPSAAGHRTPVSMAGQRKASASRVVRENFSYVDNCPCPPRGPNATARDRSPSCSAASRLRGPDCAVSLCCRPCSPHRLFQDAGRPSRLLPIQSTATIQRACLQLSQRAQTPCTVAERPASASHSLRCAFGAQSREANPTRHACEKEARSIQGGQRLRLKEGQE